MDTTKIFESQPWLNNSLQNRIGIARLASMGTKEKSMVVYMTNDDGFLVLSATWQEILDAMAEGKNVVCVDKVEGVVYGAYPVVCIYYDGTSLGDKYYLKIQRDEIVTFSCVKSDDNPFYEL